MSNKKVSWVKHLVNEPYRPFLFAASKDAILIPSDTLRNRTIFGLACEQLESYVGEGLRTTRCSDRDLSIKDVFAEIIC
jgi:hypothetical protein